MQLQGTGEKAWFHLERMYPKWNLKKFWVMFENNLSPIASESERLEDERMAYWFIKGIWELDLGAWKPIEHFEMEKF